MGRPEETRNPFGMKILLTGATGFIGWHLLEALRDDGHEIVVLTRRAAPVFPEGFRPAALVAADLSDAAALAPAFEGVDVVVNLAAELREQDKFESTNITGVENLIAQAKRCGVERIVHLSSVGVVGMQYSPRHVVVDEETPCDPKNDYERTKLRSEQLFREKWSTDPAKLVMLRPTNVFGENHPRHALLNLLKTIQAGKTFICTADALVNYVYVKDLAYAIRHFIMKEPTHTVYNVGNAAHFTVFHRQVAKLLGVKPHCRVLPRWCFALPEALNYMGRSGVKAKLRSLSNGVEYSDLRLLGTNPDVNVLGTHYGLVQTIADYKARKLL